MAKPAELWRHIGGRDTTGANYIPERLPCGRVINQSGRTDQCCRTECPEKSSEEIERCYERHKHQKVDLG